MKSYDMACIPIFSVLMAVCSWIAVPTAVPFTLQTFALFLTMGVLGGKRGTMAILIYILLGAMGIPVFSGFTGGVGILLGTTGGYITGFFFSALTMWALEKILGTGTWALTLSMIAAMAVYFAVGTAWFMTVYVHQTGPVELTAVLSWCVIPFIIPDLIKMILALLLKDRLKRIIKF